MVDENGDRALFVAQPAEAPYNRSIAYRRPDDLVRDDRTWRDEHGKFVLIVGVESRGSSARRRAFVAALSHVRRRISPCSGGAMAMGVVVRAELGGLRA